MENQIRSEINYLQEQLYRAHDRPAQRALFDEIERYRGILMDYTGEYEEIKVTDDEEPRYMSTFGDGSAFINGVYDGRYNRQRRQCNCPQCTGTQSIQINLSDLATLQSLNDMLSGIMDEDNDEDLLNALLGGGEDPNTSESD